MFRHDTISILMPSDAIFVYLKNVYDTITIWLYWLIYRYFDFKQPSTVLTNATKIYNMNILYEIFTLYTLIGTFITKKKNRPKLHSLHCIN